MSRKIKWTEQLKNYLKEKAAEMSDEELSKKMSIGGQYFSKRAIRHQRTKMGLVKCCGRGIIKLKD